jgi:hypothetical protein
VPSDWALRRFPCLYGIKGNGALVVLRQIATDKRTVLSYLTKPLADQITHAFRER